MANSKTYPDEFTYRRRSVFPVATQRTIHALGRAAQSRSLKTKEIAAFRDAIGTLDAAAASRASREISQIGGLYSQNATFSPLRFLLRFLSARPPANSGWFFLFHYNGLMREKAISGLREAPGSAFELSAIVYRMNDWAPQVRAASFRYAEEFFPRTSPAVIAKAAFFLLEQVPLLTRWDKAARDLVLDTVFDAAVVPVLKEMFLEGRTGREARVIRAALRHPALDPALPDLALNARSSSVRALAFEALLRGRAQWCSGKRQVWVDKSLGYSRHVPNVKHRPLSLSVDLRPYFLAASVDKSAQVRRVAATLLLDQMQDRQDWHAQVAETLKDDQSTSVSSRMDFYFRNRQPADT